MFGRIIRRDGFNLKNLTIQAKIERKRSKEKVLIRRIDQVSHFISRTIEEAVRWLKVETLRKE